MFRRGSLGSFVWVSFRVQFGGGLKSPPQHMEAPTGLEGKSEGLHVLSRGFSPEDEQSIKILHFIVVGG